MRTRAASFQSAGSGKHIENSSFQFGSPGFSPYSSVKVSSDHVFKVWCLVETLHSDPAISIFVCRSLCLVGTLLGRVVAFSFDRPLSSFTSDEIRLRSADAMMCSLGNDDSETVKHQNIFKKLSRKNSSRKNLNGAYRSFGGKMHFFLCKGQQQQIHPMDIIPEKTCLFQQNISLSSSIEKITHPSGRLHLLAAYSDDSIRMLFADQGFAYAVLGNNTCRVWSLDNFSSHQIIKLDRRITANFKCALPAGRKLFIASSGMSMIIDIPTQQSFACCFRVPDKDVVLCDFNGTCLLMISYSSKETPIIKLMNVSTVVDGPGWGRVPECIFRLDMHKTKIISHLGFWGSDTIVFTHSGRDIFVYRWKTNSLLYKLQAHTANIVALDTSDPRRLISISISGELCVWSGGELILLLRVKKVRFDNGLPYVIQSYGRWVFFGADQGIFLLDLGEDFQ